MVLARKYRPQSFEAMVGQGHVVQALSNALTQQRLHHAYLFTGTRGVGKTTVSRILAKSLNCVGHDGTGGITAHPCGQCQPCRDIDAGRFVDYVELDAASNRGVEEISQLLDQAVYKPVVGRFKVYMIDEVHMLTNHAFNAMLKTLEEPPEYLKFVLATTDPQKVPVTVLSRCLQFNLRPMAVQTVLEHLQTVLGAEQIDFEQPALALLARAARGSMRDALSLTDQAIAFGGGTLQEQAVRQMLGAVDRQHVQRIIEAVAACDGAALVAAVDTLRQLGLSASGTLEELASALQRMAVVQAVPGAMGADDPDAALWDTLAGVLAPDETQLFYSLVLQGRAELALSPDEYSGLLMLLLRLLAFKPGSSVGSASPPKAEGSAPRHAVAEPAPAAAPQGLVTSTSRPAVTPAPPRVIPVVVTPPPASEPAVLPRSRPVTPPSDEPPPWDEPPVEAYDEGHVETVEIPEPEEAAVPAAQPMPVPARRPVVEPAPEAAVEPLTDLPANAQADRWTAVVQSLCDKGLIAALVRELAMQAQCLGFSEGADGSVWRLRVERDSLRGDNHRDRLAVALTQLLGQPARLDLEGGAVTDTPAIRDQLARQRRQRAAEELIQQDPLVVDLLRQYPEARVVPGSIRPV